MFDKLIESNSVEAEFKPRRKFFMVSSVVVGILFITAVVASLYAQELDLGTNSFELVEMIAPVAAEAPEPEPPRQQQRQNDQQETSELPNRQNLVASIDEPTKIPDQISTAPSKDWTIPKGSFTNDPGRPNSDGSGTPGARGADNSSSGPEVVPSEPNEIKAPPPVAKAEPKKTVTQTKGVINGYAIDLPKPIYPAAAKAIRLSGVVNVQVLIDEYGTVVSAKAIDGPAVFKGEAERSAKRAKFKPTYLSDQPTKVTGVIVYKFIL